MDATVLVLTPTDARLPVQVPRRVGLDVKPELDLVTILPGQLNAIDEELVQLQVRAGQLQELRVAKQALNEAAARVCDIYEAMKCTR